MKSTYPDIMEQSLSAYSDGNIAACIREVEAEGLKEHGHKGGRPQPDRFLRQPQRHLPDL